MPTLKLRISGMRHADEERIKQALEAEPGVYGVEASHESGCADVDYEDDEVAIDRLIELIRAVGFEAELAG
ncbi:MAG: heavy-metal-associated domain-containing protein [Gemmatimonadetes bacterium]|nr:heavy-metal-associated domain-containing protein [Gemmatimonadota bacterium]